MIIHQGDLYWIQFQDDETSEPCVHHPHVVIQQNVLNQDQTVDTVVVCALTTNARKIGIPGNVLIEPGEGNLTKRSIVEVSKIITINKRQLGHYIGTISQQRVDQILAGIAFVQRSYFDR